MITKKSYYKLVRDRIPEVLDNAEKEYQVSQVRGEELTSFALKKLREEVEEFVEEPSAEEAGDILEVLGFICERLAIGEGEIKAARLSKRVTKGGFDMGFLLEWVKDR